MPGVGDWIGEPLAFVSNFLESKPDEYKDKCASFFTQRISGSEEARQWISSFNSTSLHEIKPDSLVRFRCMVQDMFGPEYYYDVFETEVSTSGEKKLHSGRYRDVTPTTDGSEILHNSAATKTSERQVFYCVPVPGESNWVKQGHNKSCLSPRSAGSSRSHGKTKRTLEDESEMDTGDAPSSAALCNGDSEANKRSRPDSTDDVNSQANGAASTSVLTPAVSLNFPLPGETGPAALVKVYDDTGDTLKLNDIVEIYGVISTDPSLSLLSAEENEMLSAEEQKAHNPPASLVPRIHAVHITKIQSTNPLITADTKQQLAAMIMDARDIRENLLSILEHALGGDKLSAEYFLCHLISSVYIRKDLVAVGKLSLNLTKIQPDSQLLVNSLMDLVQQMVTGMYRLPMSLDNMNKLSFTPTKDYEANRLKSGILQLPDHCHLILDETALQPGQLDVNGVKNLTALGNLIKWQKVAYDFKFHQQEFPADVPVLALSEGKSLLPFDIVIPLQVDSSIPLQSRLEAIQTYLSPELLDKIRLYLTLIPDLEYELTENISKIVQEDFVSARQTDKEAMSADDFQTLLVLSRLMSISHGLSDLTPDLWNKVKAMEEQRKIRLAN